MYTIGGKALPRTKSQPIIALGRTRTALGAREMDQANPFIQAGQLQRIEVFGLEPLQQNTVVLPNDALRTRIKRAVKLRSYILGPATLACAIVCGVLVVHWRKEAKSNECLLAVVYSYPDDAESAQGGDLKYVSAYRNAWLEFFAKSRLTESGNFECPGGQTYNKAVEDAHLEAWKLIHRLEKLSPLERRRVFGLLQLSVSRELAAVAVQNR